MIQLKELSMEDGQPIYEFISQLTGNENGFVNPGYGVMEAEFKDFLGKKIAEANGLNLKEGYVPQTIYWAYLDEMPIGIVKMRHYLNEHLLLSGGHIGYLIRPGYRGKGYGTLMLKEALIKAAEKGIEKVLITADESNLASRKVIEANGGILEDVAHGHCRYWINQPSL